MAHVRQQIRQAVVVALTGLPTTGTNVSAGRALPLSGPSKPPALVVYTWPDAPVYEDAELGAGKCIVSHNLTIQVEGFYSGGDDDDLDEMAVEVEEAMYADETFGGLAQAMQLAGQDVARDDAGQRVEGAIVMLFTVQYLAAEGEPETAL